MTETLTAAPIQKTGAAIYKEAVLNRPISRLNGLSVRKIANIIHNSLTLVENPDSLNYNTSARLYRLLTKSLERDERMNLNALLSEYASEDEDLRNKLIELNRFRRNRAEELSTYGRYQLNSADDVAADLMAKIAYRAGMANARFAETGKSESLRLEELAEKYAKKKDELKGRGINLDSVFSTQLNHLTVSYNVGGRNIYRNHLEDFMSKYNELNKSSMKMVIKKNGCPDMVAPVRGSSIEDRFKLESKNGILDKAPDASEHVLAENHQREALDKLEYLFGEKTAKPAKLNTDALLLK